MAADRLQSAALDVMWVHWIAHVAGNPVVRVAGRRVTRRRRGEVRVATPIARFGSRLWFPVEMCQASRAAAIGVGQRRLGNLEFLAAAWNRERVAASGVREYEVTLAEIGHPPHRDGMRFVTRIWRSRRRDAAAAFRDRFSVLDVRRVRNGR